ncbi:hypothetical protein [Candidatus Villigracilis saccharophilus]|uniref:hypothetical protein n=1 Tax=Candidatus Villigracilis saccharophilus TaxID=3140684 RepID=UPI0031369AA6|nr:hypothetical protein [Anaerolineales bacterium]
MKCFNARRAFSSASRWTGEISGQRRLVMAAFETGAGEVEMHQSAGSTHEARRSPFRANILQNAL